MFRQTKFFAKFCSVITLLYVLGGGVKLPAEAKIKFGSTTIDKVPNIIKVTTGKSNIQIGKKSLMFLERAPYFNKGSSNTRYSDGSYMQARIFQFNVDGSILKEFKFAPVDNTGSMFIQNDWDLKKVQPAISNQASASGYAVKYNGGNGTNDSDKKQKGQSPVQMLPRSVSNNQLQITSKTVATTPANGSNRVNFYGSGALTLPNYNGEIFVEAHAIGQGSVKTGSTLDLTFSFFKYVQDGELDLDFETSKTGYTVQDGGLKHASITTGDFDSDGCKNDIALAVWGKYTLSLHVFTLDYNADKNEASLVKRYQKEVYNYREGYGDTTYDCASGNVFTGDFDGDGSLELAILYINGGDIRERFGRGIVYYKIYKWNSGTKTFDKFDANGLDCSTGFIGCQGVAADLDGDGMDEMVFVGLGRRSYASDAQIVPIILVNRVKGLRHDNANGNVFDDENTDVTFGKLNEIKYFANEAFSIAAGPFTGKFGKSKPVDDIVLSFTDTSKKIYIIPAPVDSSGNYVVRKENNYYSYLKMNIKKIYESSTLDSSMSGKYNSAGIFRGGLAAADFLGEGIELEDCEQLCDTHDSSYAAIIPAIPYHVDNLNEEATELTDTPTNFTYSGFHDDGVGGEMAMTYKRSEKKSSSSILNFTSTGTEDTIIPNDGSGIWKVADDYLQFKRMSSHLLADFGGDTKAGQMGSIMAKFYDFFNTTTETITTKMNESATTYTLGTEISASNKDAVILLDAKTYTWRYKVLANYLPEWLGKIPGSINENPVPASDSNKGNEYYISFSMMDELKESNNTNTYQPRHEEGNLFSYPAQISDVEGYNENGKLMDSIKQYAVPVLNKTKVELDFTKAETVTDQSKEDTTPSEATKTLNFFESAWGDIKSLFGGSSGNVQNTPDKTEHSKSFSKSYATDEQITAVYSGRSTLPDTSVKYTVDLMPYVAKEGTMRVAAAVNFDTSPWYLFNKTDSLYKLLPDPALFLPNKWKVEGSSFAAQKHHDFAMLARGIRFYCKDLGAYTDSVLVANGTYQIEVPLYNASFKRADNVLVRLSYSSKYNPEVKQDKSRTLIQEKTINLGAWSNVKTNNHGVVKFDWKIPNEIADGNYYFYIDVDPNNTIKEVHESRMLNTKTVADWGGNNEGFFAFSVFHVDSDNIVNSSTAGSVLYSSVSNSNSSSNSRVRTSDSDEDYNFEMQPILLDTNITFNGSQYLPAVMEELCSPDTVSPDNTVTIECEIENLTSQTFTKAVLYGFNVMPIIEREDSTLSADDFRNAFLRHEVSLFPNAKVKFTFAVRAGNVDVKEGIGFILYDVSPYTNSVKSEERDYGDMTGDEEIIDAPGEGSSEESGDILGSSSSSSGCNSGVSLLGLVIMLSALILRRKSL